MSNEEPEYGDFDGTDKSSSEEGAPGSLPDNFNSRLSSLREERNISMSEYCSVINEIRGMASGGDAGGIREKYYHGWTNKHFGKLLEELGEK